MGNREYGAARRQTSRADAPRGADAWSIGLIVSTIADAFKLPHFGPRMLAAAVAADLAVWACIWIWWVVLCG
ncbi:hypothetical protein GMI70_02975 [Eggerthellaceae bacterium zg-893]|nr:hypothetical protein [Eggerthellaceae bacterium zg-893]